MQLPANGCEAILADTDQTPECSYGASAPSPFCHEHAEEHHALEEREQAAAREANQLKSIVDDIIAEGAEGYTRVKDIRKDERVVRLYLESLEQQVGTAVAPKTSFLSKAAERGGSESLAVLEERKGSVVTFLAALQARADTLERRELEREQELITPPSDDPEPVPVSVSVPDVDEPLAYPILDIPHPPYACTADSSDSSPAPRGLPDRCIALRLRDGQRCTWTCILGQRFCIVHLIAHGTVVKAHKVKEGMLEAQRIQIVRGEGDQARRIKDVKTYVDKLEDMAATIGEHQRLFSCRSLDSHAALLKDLKKRRTSAGLLLGELSGRTDAKVAENQGQAETWAAAYLAEMKHKDAIERLKTGEDLLTGAIIGGAAVWFGVPWAGGAIAGVISSLVMRGARESADDDS